MQQYYLNRVVHFYKIGKKFSGNNFCKLGFIRPFLTHVRICYTQKILIFFIDLEVEVFIKSKGLNIFSVFL